MNKAYPKYKQSGVEWLGEVPEHWEVKKLKYCAPIVTTKAGSSGSNPIALENIESWTGRFIETDSEFEGEGIRFKMDDVLFGKLRPYLAKVYLAEKNGESVGDIFVLRPAKGTASKYLSYALRTENYIEIIDSSTYGSKMPRASWEFMGCLPFLLPPLPEQQAIASFLDSETGKIDALIAKQERLLELLAEQRTALISRAVTKGLDASVKLKPSGVEWLGEVPEHWEVWKLAHGFDFVGSGTTPPSDELEWYDGATPWITTSELRENLITNTDKCVSKEAISRFSALKIFPKGSLAIAMYGATIGRLGILGIEATTNQACCVMHGGQVFSVNFVYFWMQAFKETIILLASGGGQPNISQDKIKSLKIPCPSVQEQQSIASFLDRETGKIDALSAKVTTVIDKLKEYRTALISSAVSGKIDVREAV
mgnify:CR=1 FL=1